MNSRPTSARKSPRKASSGQPQLTLAKVIVLTEAGLRCFARPLFFAGLFIALAWLGFFTKLYPFAHLVSLAIFVVLFFDALGKATRSWKTPSSSDAKRRVEEASGLSHRPLDVLNDHAITSDSDTQTLWQMHVKLAEERVQNLRWPHVKINFAQQDPHGLRYVVAVLLTFGLIAGWGALGSRMIAAINPSLGKMQLSTATIDAWISPPAYTHLPPIMIATPAGDRFKGETIDVPEGSILHAHLAEKDGETPILEANNQSTEFSAAEGKDFDVTQNLTSGDRIAIRRGWMSLASWHIHVVPDMAPEIAFHETPSASEHKSVRIAYDAKDDYGVTSVTLRLTPRVSLPGVNNDPVEFPLATTDTKEIQRVDFKDLTAEPWAGMMVELQLIAADAVGHKTESSKVSMTLPERDFFQPVARALIEERKKLMTSVGDTKLQSETANLMAGVAHQPASFGYDPLVMMALRSGAVRLVLDHDGSAVASVKDILWKTAVRIEDGMVGMAEQNLRQAQQELADALDKNASEKDIQSKIDRLHQALAQYLAQLSTRVAAQPANSMDFNKVMGSRTNVLTPQDLDKMLNEMRSLSASGARSEARQELSKLQQLMENMQTHPKPMNAEQQAALDNLKKLQQLTKDQQELMDSTFQKAQSGGQESKGLAESQSGLLTRLKSLMEHGGQDKVLVRGAEAMIDAKKVLQKGDLDTATVNQNEALKALQTAEHNMAQNLQQSLFALPQPGEGSGSDPFGRDGGNAYSEDKNSVHIPDHMEALHVREILNEIQHRAGDMARPKTERDYIERLLQNF